MFKALLDAQLMYGLDLIYPQDEAITVYKYSLASRQVFASIPYFCNI